MQQAESASQSSVGSADYRWATLTQDSQIGGRTFSAGTRIAVAPAQTQTSGGGKAHTTSVLTKVWAKFGQTFDASSWVQGWLAASAFSYTGQKATWSNATGFGELTSMQGRRRGYRPPVPVPTAVESPLDHAAALERAQGYRPPTPVPTAVESPAESMASPIPARGVSGTLSSMDEAAIVRKTAGHGVRRAGAGSISVGGAAALLTAFSVGGGIGGGLLFANFASKHKVGATIAGTLLGSFIAPVIGGAILDAVAGGVDAKEKETAI